MRGRLDWSGRVAGLDVNDAAFRVADAATILDRRGYELEAVSLTHGRTHIAASRVPELDRFTRTIDVGIGM